MQTALMPLFLFPKAFFSVKQATLVQISQAPFHLTRTWGNKNAAVNTFGISKACLHNLKTRLTFHCLGHYEEPRQGDSPLSEAFLLKIPRGQEQFYPARVKFLHSVGDVM